MPSHSTRRRFAAHDEVTDEERADPRHERYFTLLRQTITNTYVKMIVPGAP